MKPYMLALGGLALAISCSSQGGDQRVPADDDLAPPLEMARVDTSQPVAAVEHEAKAPVSPEVKAPAPTKAKPALRKARRPPRKAPVDTAVTLAAASKEDTSTVRGYAPNAEGDSSSVDTAGTAVADTASPVVSDTEATASPIVDTVPSPVIDSAVANRKTASGPGDTAVTAPRDTAMPAVRDTSAAVPDTSAARDSGATSPAPVPAAASNVGAASSVAARTLPVGTEIHAALDDSINSRKDTVGRTVTAVVMENITGSDGKTLIAAGTPVRLTVTRLSPARSKSSQGRLKLKVEGIGIGQGHHTVSAEVQAVPHELRGRGVTAGDAAKVGVGAAAGAVAGKVIGKNTKGAVIGGVIGAAGGAVVASQTATRDVFVKARTPVTLRLTQPLVVVK
jgi:hypothetical protein